MCAPHYFDPSYPNSYNDDYKCPYCNRLIRVPKNVLNRPPTSGCQIPSCLDCANEWQNNTLTYIRTHPDLYPDVHEQHPEWKFPWIKTSDI
jgi:hypothetical protein